MLRLRVWAPGAFLYALVQALPCFHRTKRSPRRAPDTVQGRGNCRAPESASDDAFPRLCTCVHMIASRSRIRSRTFCNGDRIWISRSPAAATLIEIVLAAGLSRSGIGEKAPRNPYVVGTRCIPRPSCGSCVFAGRSQKNYKSLHPDTGLTPLGSAFVGALADAFGFGKELAIPFGQSVPSPFLSIPPGRGDSGRRLVIRRLRPGRLHGNISQKREL